MTGNASYQPITDSSASEDTDIDIEKNSKLLSQNEIKTACNTTTISLENLKKPKIIIVNKISNDVCCCMDKNEEEENDKIESNSNDSESKKIDFLEPRVCVSLLLFMVSGPSLIVVNNYILHDLEFAFPIMISSFGIFGSTVIISFGVKLNWIKIRQEIIDMVNCSFFCKKIALIACVQAITLATGNQCYNYLSVSLIQMLKSFTPAFTLVLFIIAKQTVLNKHLTFAITLLVIGTCVTALNITSKNGTVTHAHSSDNNDNTHNMEEEETGNDFIKNVYGIGDMMWGLCLVLVSDFAEAFRVVLTHCLLHSNTPISDNSEISNNSSDSDINNNNNENRNNKNSSNNGQLTVFESLYYYCPITFVFLWFLIIMDGEWSDFMVDYESNLIIIYRNWGIFTLAGFLGFLVNVSGWLVTHVISGLYLKALGTFRNVCLVVLAVLVFGETVTMHQSFGYGISICGFAYYNYIKTK